MSDGDDLKIIIGKNNSGGERLAVGWRAIIKLPIMEDLTDGAWLELVILGEKVTDTWMRKMFKDSEKAIDAIDHEVAEGHITSDEGNAQINELVKNNRERIAERNSKS